MPSTFTTVKTIVTGPGSVSELGVVARTLGRRALVVTGGGSLEKAGLLGRARDALRGAGIEFDEHPGLLPEPDLAAVELLRGRLREDFDLAISIGGGSVMDAAKAAAGLACEDAPAREFHAGRRIEVKGLPHVAVPTTAGTGAEVTPNAVITDPEGPRKASIRGPQLLPAAAVVDPELLVSVPPRVTAESGMDALVQAIESYISIHATPLTEVLSLGAVTLLAQGLVPSFEHGSDVEARTACAYGSLAAGMALANARLGVVHGVAHPLGAWLHVGHGQACAMLLIPSIHLNQQVARVKYIEVAKHIGEGLVRKGTDGLTAAGITRAQVEHRAPRLDVLVESIMDKLGLAKKLPAEMAEKLDEDTAAKIVEESLASGSLKANPLEIEPEHVRKLLSGIIP